MRLMRLAVLSILVSAVLPTITAAPKPPPPYPPHPRVLANAADFERIRAAISRPGPMRDAFEVLKAAAEAEFEDPPCRRVMVGRRLLDTSRLALRRIWNAALLYQLTGDRRWSSRAEKEMIALADFSDWNPSHFLDVAEAAAAIAVGYDWTFDALSRDSREILRDALVENALLPGSSDKAAWRRFHNNWRQVCEAGLALAAISVGTHAPELARAAIERAKRNVPPIFNTYEPAGAYVEGPMYWEYGTTYHVLLIEALRSATGSSGSLADNASFLKSGSVINMLTTPTGGWFNYGDSNYRRGFMPVMFWFARENRRPALAFADYQFLEHLARTCRRTHLDDASLPSRFLALSLLWMQPDAPSAPPDPPRSWSTTGANPLAVFRQGSGRASLFVGMKGGRARNSHAHMDAGSFLLELAGERWTADLGKPDYELVERAGVDLFGKDRWKVYAVGPHSHSIPLINDAPPNETFTATLYAYSANDQMAVFNLTPLYSNKARRLHRALRVTSPTSIHVRDEFDGVAPGSRYRFSWMTRATVQTDAAGATLRQNGRTLRINVSSDAPFSIVNEDASLPPARWDMPNPGLRRLSILATTRARTHFIDVRASLVTTPSDHVLAMKPVKKRPRAPVLASAFPTFASRPPIAHEPAFLREFDEPRAIASPRSPYPPSLVGADEPLP